MLLILKIIFFIMAIVSAVIGVKYHKKILTCMSIGAIVYLLLSIGLLLFKLTLIPNIDGNITLLFAFFVALGYVFSFKHKKYEILCVIGLSMVFIIIICFFCGQFQVYTTDEKGNTYIGIGDELTSVSETVVNYHRSYYKIFMSTDCYYSENYGIVFSTWESILNREPYSVEYYID